MIAENGGGSRGVKSPSVMCQSLPRIQENNLQYNHSLQNGIIKPTPHQWKDIKTDHIEQAMKQIKSPNQP